MTNKASKFLKHVVTALTSMAKAKTNAIRNRIIIFSLLRNKRFFLSSFSDKLQNLASKHQRHKIKSNDDDDDVDDDQSDNDNDGAMVRYDYRFLSNPTCPEVVQEEASYFGDGGGEEDDKYPDLTHSLLNDEDLDNGGSVIDLVKKSKPEGEEFRLEDEIDRVADLFIRKFHRQIRMQRQLSLKMHEEILKRSD